MNDISLFAICLLLFVVVHFLLEGCLTPPLSMYDAEVGLPPADHAVGSDKAAGRNGAAPLPLP